MDRFAVFVLCAACGLLLLSASPARGEGDAYDFRDTDAYRSLSDEDRGRLEQVHHDFTTLWGALDRYAEEHDSTPPDALSKLTPRYLLQLPRDPFSSDGYGHYSYRRGAGGNRAWVLASAGLPEFPYLAARGNVSLYVCKGTWISGVNPLVVESPKPKDAALRARMAKSMDNLRTLARLFVERSLRKRWPRYDGKNFVLSLVADGVVDVRDPEKLQVFFSLGDSEFSAEKVDPERWGEVTKQALKAGRDFHELTSYAGRRNADRDFLITPDGLKRVIPILADASFPGVVLIAFSNGEVEERTWAELGIPQDEPMPLMLGDDTPSELLRALSNE